jgi:hypothetical protein
MKKYFRNVLLASSLLVSAAWATAATSSYNINFATASGTSFTNTFLITPDVDNTLFLSVLGSADQFSSLSFQITDGPSVTASTKADSLVASFNDASSSSLGSSYTLLAGQTYQLTVTGTTLTLDSGVTGSITVYGKNASIIELPVVTGPTITTPVPEPETYAMLLAGLGVMVLVARRRSGGKV